MATISSLPALETPTPDTLLHARHGDKDYKLELGKVFSGAKQYIGLGIQSGSSINVTSDVPETEYVQNRIYWIKTPDTWSEVDEQYLLIVCLFRC